MRQLYIILRNIVVAKGGDIVDARKTNLLEDFQWCMFEVPNDAVTTLHKAHAEFNYQLPSHRRRRKEAEEDSIAATSVELLNVRPRNFTKEAQKTKNKKNGVREREREIQQKIMPKTQNFFVLCKILLLLLLPHMIYYP